MHLDAFDKCGGISIYIGICNLRENLRAIFGGDRKAATLSWSRFEDRFDDGTFCLIYKLKMKNVTDIGTLTVFSKSCAFPAKKRIGKVILRSLVRYQVIWRWRMLFRVDYHRISVDPRYIIRNMVAEVENNRWIFSHWDGTKFNEIRMLYGDEFSLGLKLM